MKPYSELLEKSLMENAIKIQITFVVETVHLYNHASKWKGQLATA